MLFTRWKWSLVGLLLSSVLMLLLMLSTAGPAFATGCAEDGSTCTYTLTGGALAPTYGSVTLAPGALNGQDQTLTITMPVAIIDQDGNGWNIQAGLTPFISGGNTLPTVLNVSMTGACASGSSCSLPDGTAPSGTSAVSLTPGASTLTAAGSTPTLSVLISTAANGSAYYGMGSMTITTTLTASLLARNTYAGTYSGKIELSVISGP
ncbi:MAG TPA: hypothetical protein VKR42_09650 [Ktedonobacteraceae bacterium]|nr:hypothetical protein [Ktedonobacteraceae bacterium]